MRQYEPIWLRLKEHNKASIATHIKNKARVIKAVIKEKHGDVGYKLLLSNKAHKAKLFIVSEIKEKDREANMITIHFSLVYEIHEPYIGIDTL